MYNRAYIECRYGGRYMSNFWHFMFVILIVFLYGYALKGALLT
nr:MAG TPA: hypothetical protein [Caudoviricetes sp.]